MEELIHAIRFHVFGSSFRLIKIGGSSCFLHHNVINDFRIDKRSKASIFSIIDNASHPQQSEFLDENLKLEIYFIYSAIFGKL